MAEDPRQQDDVLGPIATKVLYEDERVRIWDQVIEPGQTTGPHHHALPYALVTVEGAPLDVMPVAGFPNDFRLKYGRGFGKAKLVSANLSLEEILFGNRQIDDVLNLSAGVARLC